MVPILERRMQVIADIVLVAVGGWKIVLILAVVLILFAAKRLPYLGRGLRQGLLEFRRETMNLREELDEATSDAGKSIGGIYGKPACQAITPDNQTAELYEPAVLRHQQKPGWTNQKFWLLCWLPIFQRIRRFLAKRVRRS